MRTLLVVLFVTVALTASARDKVTSAMLFDISVVVCASSYTHGWYTTDCTGIGAEAKRSFCGDLNPDRINSLSRLATACCRIGSYDKQNGTNSFPSIFVRLLGIYNKVTAGGE